MSVEQIEAVELSIEQAKKQISLRDDLQKLISNKQFKKVILEGYFEKEASRLVLLKASPEMQEETSQKAIDDSIIAIGQLRQHFITINQFGAMADRTMADDQETLDELRNEGL